MLDSLGMDWYLEENNKREISPMRHIVVGFHQEANLAVRNIGSGNGSINM